MLWKQLTPTRCWTQRKTFLSPSSVADSSSSLQLPPRRSSFSVTPAPAPPPRATAPRLPPSHRSPDRVCVSSCIHSATTARPCWNLSSQKLGDSPARTHLCLSRARNVALTHRTNSPTHLAVSKLQERTSHKLSEPRARRGRSRG